MVVSFYFWDKNVPARDGRTPLLGLKKIAVTIGRRYFFPRESIRALCRVERLAAFSTSDSDLCDIRTDTKDPSLSPNCPFTPTVCIKIDRPRFFFFFFYILSPLFGPIGISARYRQRAALCLDAARTRGMRAKVTCTIVWNVFFSLIVFVPETISHNPPHSILLPEQKPRNSRQADGVDISWATPGRIHCFYQLTLTAAYQIT